MATRTILLDIGGTYIKCGDGRQIPAMSDGNRAEISMAIRKAIGPISGPAGIGIAIPGPFDYRNGLFLMKHKFASVYGESFRSLARIPSHVEVKFLHDVVAVLAGAIHTLHLEGENPALATLGTGLGFSHAIKGKVQCNESGSPSRDLWNMPAEGGGILEDELSARGISAAWERRTGESGRTCYAIARMAYAGDEVAREVFAHVGARLGEVLKNVLEELQSGILLLGGQISKSLSLMIGPMQEALPGIRILPVPDDSVFVGLSRLFESNTDNQ